MNGTSKEQTATSDALLVWTDEAEERLARVPEGFIRWLTRCRVETFARREGILQVTHAVVARKLEGWANASATVVPQLRWADAALARTERIPITVRGQIIREVERFATAKGLPEVTLELLQEAREMWHTTTGFHTPPPDAGDAE